MRLSVSHADFPNAWPSPTLAWSRLTSEARDPHAGAAVAPGRPNRCPHPIFAPPFPIEDVPRSGPAALARDPGSGRGRTELKIESKGASQPDSGYIQETSSTATAFVDERNPANAWMRGHQIDRYRGQDRRSRPKPRPDHQTETAFNVPFTLKSRSMTCLIPSAAGSRASRAT